MKLVFQEQNETKGSVVFHETDGKGNVLETGYVVGRIYIRKDQIGKGDLKFAGTTGRVLEVDLKARAKK